MNPLLWGLLAGGVGLAALAGGGGAQTNVPAPAPAPRPTPTPIAPKSSTSVPFTKENITLAVDFALAHETNLHNLQAFALALMEYGWVVDASKLNQKVGALILAQGTPHHVAHHAGHHHG